MKAIFISSDRFQRSKKRAVLQKRGTIFVSDKKNTNPQTQALQEAGFKKHKEGTAEILHPQLGSSFESRL
jgi:UDP-N-acetylenolpyruvoylglucosamine reductase